VRAAAERRCGTYQRALALWVWATIALLRPRTVTSCIFREVRDGSRRPKEDHPSRPTVRARVHAKGDPNGARDVATGRGDRGKPSARVDLKVSDFSPENSHPRSTYRVPSRGRLGVRAWRERVRRRPPWAGAVIPRRHQGSAFGCNCAIAPCGSNSQLTPIAAVFQISRPIKPPPRATLY
jgi:hypothetical protein